ncbi:VOC family protein [Paraburkholderia sp.]|uniref:VOC family protein n=1 Tax=Paraburkholderia sp. TaxID=1926495 RepID=UPI003D6E3C5B
MSPDPYLMFDGTCAEAMRFYERTLGGRMKAMMTHAESPLADQMPPENAQRILHAALEFDGRLLMASDTMVGHPYEGMKGFMLALNIPTVDEAHRIFNTLAEGGTVNMPMQKTFWAESFGMAIDRFGTPWAINGNPHPL